MLMLSDNHTVNPLINDNDNCMARLDRKAGYVQNQNK